MSTTPPLNNAIEEVRTRLAGFLPAALDGLPQHAVSLTAISERAVGLGNRRGVEFRGVFGVLELKGLQVDATARFELWAAGPDDVNALVEALQEALWGAREDLFRDGFLRVEAAGTSTAEPVDTDIWRRTADYRLLFEHRFSDPDGAPSLIARIPIHSDPEERNSPFRETTVVVDEMARWDNEAAPDLVVRGPATVSGLGVLGFVAGAQPTGTVTLTRSFGGAGPPTELATPADFLEAVTDPAQPARNVQTTVDTIADLLTNFTDAGEVALGDWDANDVVDTYQSHVLTFARPLLLPSAGDTFTVAYEESQLDRVAVLYLRAVPN